MNNPFDLFSMMGANPQQAASAVSPGDAEKIRSTVEQYSGKSEQELVGELKTARASGAIDPAQLQQVAARLMPMLNPEQRQRMESVLRSLEE